MTNRNTYHCVEKSDGTIVCTPAKEPTLSGYERRLVLHLRSILEYAERETCTHEETHRGGAIWEICDRCGMKWADDEGGKPDNTRDLPKVLTDARDFLDSLQNAPVLATADTKSPPP